MVGNKFRLLVATFNLVERILLTWAICQSYHTFYTFHCHHEKKVTSCQKLARQVITGISTIPYKIQMVLNFEVKIEIFKTQI